MSSFEAALNLLREQRRTVKDVRWDLMRDGALKRDDPAHYQQLMVQTQAEQSQLTAAIDLLQAVESGDLMVTSLSVPPVASVPISADAPVLRQHGLVRRTVERRV